MSALGAGLLLPLAGWWLGNDRGLQQTHTDKGGRAVYMWLSCVCRSCLRCQGGYVLAGAQIFHSHIRHTHTQQTNNREKKTRHAWWCLFLIMPTCSPHNHPLHKHKLPMLLSKRTSPCLRIFTPKPPAYFLPTRFSPIITSAPHTTHTTHIHVRTHFI